MKVKRHSWLFPAPDRPAYVQIEKEGRRGPSFLLLTWIAGLVALSWLISVAPIALLIIPVLIGWLIWRTLRRLSSRRNNP